MLMICILVFSNILTTRLSGGEISRTAIPNGPVKTPAMGETCLATITLEVGSRVVGLRSIDNNIYNSVTHANLKFINLASTIC
jgi:hypothetical protein